MQLSGLRSLWQWILLSWYLPTIYDLIMGLLCILNSSYILFKICYSDRRLRNEPKLMSAVARLFGRKKIPVVPQRDIELGIVDTTPTAPLEPSQPTVNAIRNDNMPTNSRRVRYGMNYEYMPEEIRPLRSSLRQPNREMEMEMDDFDEYPRRYLKR